MARTLRRSFTPLLFCVVLLRARPLKKTLHTLIAKK